MPWKVVKRDGKHCVVKSEDGAIVKCHDSASEAVAHKNALYANTQASGWEWGDDPGRELHPLLQRAVIWFFQAGHGQHVLNLINMRGIQAGGWKWGDDPGKATDPILDRMAIWYFQVVGHEDHVRNLIEFQEDCPVCQAKAQLQSSGTDPKRAMEEHMANLALAGYNLTRIFWGHADHVARLIEHEENCPVCQMEAQMAASGLNAAYEDYSDAIYWHNRHLERVRNPGATPPPPKPPSSGGGGGGGLPTPIPIVDAIPDLEEIADDDHPGHVRRLIVQMYQKAMATQAHGGGHEGHAVPDQPPAPAAPPAGGGQPSSVPDEHAGHGGAAGHDPNAAPDSDSHLNHMAETFEQMCADESCPECCKMYADIARQLREAVATPAGSPERKQLAGIMTGTLGASGYKWTGDGPVEPPTGGWMNRAAIWMSGVLGHEGHIQKLILDHLSVCPECAAQLQAGLIDDELPGQGYTKIPQNTFRIVDPILSDGALVAHADPATAPPASFFTDPKLPTLQRYLTITSSGRIFGHLAAWGECHIGYGDMCVSPPEESDYSYFTVGTVLTSDGTPIPTGPIALKGGHADLSADAATARAHYDDPTTAKADVAIGRDSHGIWFSGAIRPSATPDDIHALRASGVSGDWRMLDGELHLIGICAVNVPGFPKVAIAASAAGEIEALVNPGSPPLPDPDLDCNCSHDLDDIQAQVNRLDKILTAAGVRDTYITKLEERFLDPFEALESRLS